MPRSAGFTLIELLTVITVIALLTALLIPVGGRMRTGAEKTKCLHNLRQIGIGMVGFCAENNGRYPTLRGYNDSQGNWQGPFWSDQIEAYTGSISGAEIRDNNQTAKHVFYCPSSELHHKISDYGVNPLVIIDPPQLKLQGLPAVRVRSPAQTVLALDCGQILQTGKSMGRWNIPASWISSPPATPFQASGPLPRHGGQLNVLFCDGRVEGMSYENLVENTPEWFAIE